jgi:hypothetical protein
VGSIALQQEEKNIKNPSIKIIEELERAPLKSNP